MAAGGGDDEEKMQQLRSKATELLLREEWRESIEAYSDFISLCQDQIFKIHEISSNPDRLFKLKSSLCLALSNRAEARFRNRDFSQALSDCDAALKVESTHFKTLLCRGKILLSLDRYAEALKCFKLANLYSQATANSEILREFQEKCKKLEMLSKTGSFDLSDWILSGFGEKAPELAEFIGAVEIKKSEISGRGLFATKNIDCGTVIFVTKAVAAERAILPRCRCQDSGENAQLVMWKNFVDKIVESTQKCSRTSSLISLLSLGDKEEEMEVPRIDAFRPESQEIITYGKLEMDKITSILDVNSLVEDAISAKVLGKNSHYHGVGLWLLASFINHSCDPNVRRLHVGDHLILHASRDVKVGEELTFSYFDVLCPVSDREEMAKGWGFKCKCRRCKFEEAACSKQEIREIEMVLKKGQDKGGIVYRLEEEMRSCAVRGKGKGYLRASFWAAYSELSMSEKLMRKWGRRIPPLGTLLDSIVDAVGSDERIVKIIVEKLKSNGNVGAGNFEIDRAMKLGKGIYGKTVRKQALRRLLKLGA